MTTFDISTESRSDSSGRSSSGGIGKRVLAWLGKYYLVVILALLCVVVGILRPSFWGAGNITNVLFQTAFVGIAACGMTVLIAGAMIDLSVGGVIAVASIATAMILPQTTVALAIFVALAAGAVMGLINGLLVTYVKIAPFIATLGTLYLYLGFAFIATNQKVIPIVSTNFLSATTGKVGMVPFVFIVFVVCAVVTAFLLHRTYFGRTVRAMGSNSVAADMAGMPVARSRVLAFVFTGVLFALSGVFMAGRLSSAEGNMAMGFEMNVIAAVVVGGTALRGGNGTMFGTMVGALVFAVINNAMNLLGIASYWQYVVTGVVLIAAVAVGVAQGANKTVRGEG